MKLKNILLCGVALYGLYTPLSASARVDFDLGAADPTLFTLKRGFSYAEGTHRWTDGDQAMIKIPVQQAQGAVKEIVFLNTFALINDGYNQTLNIALNGKFLKFGDNEELVYNFGAPTQDLRVTFQVSSGEAEIFFQFPQATQPVVLDGNPDPRKLAIAFTKGYLTFVPKGS